MHNQIRIRLQVLIYIVVATFIIAGAYVGYHYSLDPANFEAHSITAEQASKAAHMMAPPANPSVSAHNAAGSLVLLPASEGMKL